jgi:hypothetical protein
MPKIIVPSPKPTTFAPVSVRRLKIPSGTSGDLDRVSFQRKTAISTAEPMKTPIVWAEPQPTRLACVRPKTSSMRLAVTVNAPKASKCLVSPSALLSRT